MTVIVSYEGSKTVLIEGGKLFDYSNGLKGAEMSHLPSNQIKKIIGKKGAF